MSKKNKHDIAAGQVAAAVNFYNNNLKTKMNLPVAEEITDTGTVRAPGIGTGDIKTEEEIAAIQSTADFEGEEAAAEAGTIRDCHKCLMTFAEMKECGGYNGCLENRNFKDTPDAEKSEEMTAGQEVVEAGETVQAVIVTGETAEVGGTTVQTVTVTESVTAEIAAVPEKETAVDYGSEQAAGAVSGFGKFKNTEELLRAYNALEAEFTKRCQRLKEAGLEAERLRAAQAAGRDTKADFLSLVEDEEFLDSVIICNPRVKAKIIEGYLRALEGCAPAKVLGGGRGRTALQPAARPKTLEEAKKLANLLMG